MIDPDKSVQFLKKNTSKLLSAFLVLVLIIVWSERLVTRSKQGGRQDFVTATSVYESYRSGRPIPFESLESTEKIVKKHPELRSKYDAVLAASFFAQQLPEKGAKYAKSALARVKQELPMPYQKYGETSILIAQKEYDQALIEAKALDAMHATPDLLQAFNLLRLCFLEETKETQLAYWERLTHHPHYAEIAPLFKEGEATLEQLFS